MHAIADAGKKACMGDAFPRLVRTASFGQLVTTPDSAADFVHLQFRRDQWTVDELLEHAKLVRA
jgi:hypothetical protein